METLTTTVISLANLKQFSTSFCFRNDIAMTHYFLEPILALCSNRSILAKDNPIIGGPSAWLTDENLDKFNFAGVSFDFFINWTSNTLDREFWLKRPINDSAINNWRLWDDSQIATALRTDKKFLNLVYFSRKNSCSSTAIIFDDRESWGTETAGLITAHWPRDQINGWGLHIERPNQAEVENSIREKSGGAIEIGEKKLIYGTSRLECAMAQTTALWPGDVDLVLYDTQSKTPAAILEFKKHTQSSKRAFSDQCLSNYYPWPDGRKYDRLALLSAQITPGKEIPVFVIYYSTIPSELDVLIESVHGTFGSLQAGKISSVTFNPSDMQNSIDSLISTIISLIP